MVPVIYFGIAFVVFCIITFAVAINTTDRHSDETDQYLLQGLFACLASLMWPLSIFCGSFWLACMHFQKKFQRERELKEELSRG